MKLLITKSKTAKADILHSSVKQELLNFRNWGPDSEERLSVLLEAGIDVNTTDSDNTSLVMRAMLHSEAAVRTILEYGPDLGTRNTDGDTVMTMISEDTSVGSIKRVLRLGAQLDVVDNTGWSPLMIAAEANNWDVFDYLMTLEIVRSKLEIRSDAGTAMQVVCNNGNVKAVKTLLANGADINSPGEAHVGTPIMEAIVSGKDDLIQLLLENGAQLDRPAGLLYLPSFAACLRGSSDLVRLLLEKHSVAEDTVDPLGRRPAHLACYNNVEVLEQLNPPEADFAARDCVGRVPLHYACLSGDVALVETVFERSKPVGVGIEAQDNDGWTPLLWAARASSILEESCTESRNFEAVSWLLSKGADATVRVAELDVDYDNTGDNWTASDIAHYHGADKIGNLLRTHDRSERKSRRPQRVGGLGSGFCDCCLIVRCQFLLTNPSYVTLCVNSSVLVDQWSVKDWSLTSHRRFMAYISAARFAS